MLSLPLPLSPHSRSPPALTVFLLLSSLPFFLFLSTSLLFFAYLSICRYTTAYSLPPCLIPNPPFTSLLPSEAPSLPPYFLPSPLSYLPPSHFPSLLPYSPPSFLNSLLTRSLLARSPLRCLPAQTFCIQNFDSVLRYSRNRKLLKPWSRCCLSRQDAQTPADTQFDTNTTACTSLPFNSPCLLFPALQICSMNLNPLFPNGKGLSVHLRLSLHPCFPS